MRPMRLRAAFLGCLLVAACGEREAQNMSDAQVGDQLSNLRIEPGLWVLASDVVEVRAKRLPRDVRNRMIGPRSRLRHCITAEQAARPSANFLAGRNARGCLYRDFRVEGGQLSGTMICPDASTAMQGRYGPQAYDLRMDLVTPLPNGVTMTVEVRSRGRRVGACEQGGNG